MYHRAISALAAIAMTAGVLALTTPAHAAPADDAVTVGLDGLNPADPAPPMAASSGGAGAGA